ncbi:MAG: branched-chain-amino-acid transaminase [Nitrospirae bacterium]|nr:branched-chain-amino-acid transaminase [Nitrospirota bacterium]
MHVYINNRLIPESKAKVSVFDHGFLYGDGIYETMRAYEGVVFMLDEHIRRLYRSASLIQLAIPKGAAEIKSAIHKTLKANSLKNAYIRITVSRGSGKIGLDPALCEKPTFIIITNEFKDYPASFYKKGVRLIISSVKRNLKEAINPQIKSLNFLNNILAKIEAKKKKAYEALMLNSQGHLTEGTICNVFFVLKKKNKSVLCTPSLDCGILDGITRNIVLELAKKHGITTKESKFKKEDIYRASEVFITNTTMEIMPVCKVDSVSYQVGSVTKLLHEAYKENVRAYLAKVG